MSVIAKEIKRSGEIIRKSIYGQLNAKIKSALAVRNAASSPDEVQQANNHLRAMSAIFTAFSAVSMEFRNEILRRTEDEKARAVITPMFSQERQRNFSKKIDALIMMFQDKILNFEKEELSQIICEINEYRIAALLGIVSEHDIDLFRLNQADALKNIRNMDKAIHAGADDPKSTELAGKLQSAATNEVKSARDKKEVKDKKEAVTEKMMSFNKKVTKTVSWTFDVDEGFMSETEIELQRRAERKDLLEANINEKIRQGITLTKAEQENYEKLHEECKKYLEWIEFQTREIDRMLEDANSLVANAKRVNREFSNPFEIEANIIAIQKKCALIKGFKALVENEADLFKNKKSPFTSDELSLLRLIDIENCNAYVKVSEILTDIHHVHRLILKTSEEIARSAYATLETKNFNELQAVLVDLNAQLPPKKNDLTTRDREVKEFQVMNADKDGLAASHKLARPEFSTLETRHAETLRELLKLKESQAALLEELSSLKQGKNPVKEVPGEKSTELQTIKDQLALTQKDLQRYQVEHKARLEEIAELGTALEKALRKQDQYLELSKKCVQQNKELIAKLKASLLPEEPPEDIEAILFTFNSRSPLPPLIPKDKGSVKRKSCAIG